MPLFQYRLAPLLEQKEQRREQCDKQLLERRAERRRAEEQLQWLQGKQSRLEQRAALSRKNLLRVEADGDELQARVADMAILGLEIDDAKDQVFAQRMLLEDLDKRVSEAATEAQVAARQLETLRKHRAKCERLFRAEWDRKEANEQEEIAAVMYENRRRG